MVYGSAIEQARRSGYGETIERPHTGHFIPPPGFTESVLSLRLGAKTVYRDNRQTDSVQIRVYENRVTYQLDRFNPRHHPIRHAVFDAPLYTAAALGIGAVIAGAGGG